MDSDHIHDWRGGDVCICGTRASQECKYGHSREHTSYKADGGISHCKICKREQTARWRRDRMTPEQHEQIKAVMRVQARDRHYRYRRAALEHYGLECACCGEAQEEFLCIDHVNNDGNLHREEIRGGATSGGSLVTYRWLKNNEYPEGFQTLCHNCNFAKHAYSVCPHKKLA